MRTLKEFAQKAWDYLIFLLLIDALTIIGVFVLDIGFATLWAVGALNLVFGIIVIVMLGGVLSQDIKLKKRFPKWVGDMVDWFKAMKK